MACNLCIVQTKLVFIAFWVKRNENAFCGASMTFHLIAGAILSALVTCLFDPFSFPMISWIRRGHRQLNAKVSSITMVGFLVKMRQKITFDFETTKTAFKTPRYFEFGKIQTVRRYVFGWNLMKNLPESFDFNLKTFAFTDDVS